MANSHMTEHKKTVGKVLYFSHGIFSIDIPTFKSRCDWTCG